MTATPPRTPAGSASGPVQVVQGQGTESSAPLPLPEGVGFVRFTHRGQGRFTADLIDPRGFPARLTVVEGNGARTVPGVFSANFDGLYTFDVRADGPWTIEVSHPTDAEFDQDRPVPQTFSGQGPGWTPLFTAEGRGMRVSTKYSGAGEFHVVLSVAGGATRVADGDGPLETGPSNVPLPGGCTCVFLVDGDGPWTIEAAP
jgi:hypothetical protein